MSRPTKLAVVFCLAGLLSACGPRGQAATAAGIDADKNGIRDDVDALIAEEFQESPAQTIYAQRLARVMQIKAMTTILTPEQGTQIIKDEILNISCLRRNTPENLKSMAIPRLANSAFNTLERLKNSQNVGATAGPGDYVLPKDSECKL